MQFRLDPPLLSTLAIGERVFLACIAAGLVGACVAAGYLIHADMTSTDAMQACLKSHSAKACAFCVNP